MLLPLFIYYNIFSTVRCLPFSHVLWSLASPSRGAICSERPRRHRWLFWETRFITLPERFRSAALVGTDNIAFECGTCVSVRCDSRGQAHGYWWWCLLYTCLSDPIRYYWKYLKCRAAHRHFDENLILLYCQLSRQSLDTDGRIVVGDLLFHSRSLFHSFIHSWLVESTCETKAHNFIGNAF